MSLVVHIRRADLEAHSACADGLALFDAILAHQTEERARRGRPARDRLVLRWTLTHALMIAQSHGRFAAWAIERGILPTVSARGADLTGAILTRATLTGANLVGAYLTRADLTRAILTRATLAGANLAGANLAGADLAGADLTRADLAGANRYSTDAPIPGWRAVPESCGCCVRLAREVTP